MMNGLDYVKKSRNNTAINYINPYDEMIKDAKKMIKQYINQYENDIEYEFDVNSVNYIKDEIIKQKLKPFMNQFMNTQNKRILCIIIKFLMMMIQ